MTTVNKLMIGVAAGAILGVLYAPDKGSLTRRKLSRAGNDLREGLTNFKNAVSEKIDSLKQDTEDYTYPEAEVAVNEVTVAPHQSWQ